MPYFSRSKREKRKRTLKRFAFGVEGVYHEKDDFHQISLMKDFTLFRQGHSKRIFNLVAKRDQEKEINVFDYRYIVQAGNTPVKVQQTVFFINSKKLALPLFRMKPEHFFLKIGGLLGMKDINFEEFPQFSKRYWLKGENESYIRHSFKNEILKFFSIEKGWYLEGMNYYFIFYKKNKILEPDEILKFYEKGIFLFDQLVEVEKG